MTLAPKPPAPDPSDIAFLREVDEAYREDQMKRFFFRYGRWVLLAVGLVLAATGGFFWWQTERTRTADHVAEQFSLALSDFDAGAGSKAMPLFKETETRGNASYKALSLLAQAGTAVKGGDQAGAAKLLDQVAADRAAPQAIRDAAAVKAVSLSFDQLPPADVLKRLQPYLASGNPWFPVAGELAGLAHVKLGQLAEAGKLFHQVAADQGAPPSLRARAEQIGASVGADMTDLAAEAIAAPEGDAVPAASDGGAS